MKPIFKYFFDPKPEKPSELTFWNKYIEFILKKDEPLSDDNVSRWHEEFVNSNIQ